MGLPGDSLRSRNAARPRQSVSDGIRARVRGLRPLTRPYLARLDLPVAARCARTWLPCSLSFALFVERSLFAKRTVLFNPAGPHPPPLLSRSAREFLSGPYHPLPTRTCLSSFGIVLRKMPRYPRAEARQRRLRVNRSLLPERLPFVGANLHAESSIRGL